MRLGHALYIRRFAYLTVGRTSALVAVMLLAGVLAAEAQESIEEVALPPWSEPTLPSSEPAPSTQAATLPSGPESLPSAPESIPSAPEPLTSTPEPLTSTSAQPSESVPSSEQAFP